MEDVTPKLLEATDRAYQAGLNSSKTAAEIIEKIKNKNADYNDGYAYALEVGSIVSQAFLDSLTAESLPNGILYYNIAKRVIEPVMCKAYSAVADVMTDIQDIINKKAGIEVKAVKPSLNEGRLNDLINAVSGQGFSEVTSAGVT